MEMVTTFIIISAVLAMVLVGKDFMKMNLKEIDIFLH